MGFFPLRNKTGLVWEVWILDGIIHTLGFQGPKYVQNYNTQKGNLFILYDN